MQNIAANMENNMEVLQKIKMELVYNPEIPPSEIGS
jgi:hypothetical protein